MSPRWPVQPLIDAAGGRRALATLLNTSGAAIIEAANHGATDTQADRWAIRLGHHPSHFWPDWFDAALPSLDECTTAAA